MFAFVNIDGSSGKPTAMNDKSLVRSHCMRGKNKKEGSRRSIRQARKQDAVTATASTGEATIYDALSLPRASPPDLTLVSLAGDVSNLHSQQLLFKFLTYDTIKNTYPVNHCIDFHHNEYDDFQHLFHDGAYVHCILLMAATVDDSIQQRLPGQTTRFHLWRTIALLNAKLSDGDAYRIDSILFIVMTLAFITDIVNDHAAMNAHMLGLGKILQLRGGINTLRHSPKIHFKIGRLDLAWSLSTGEMPHLLSLPEPVLWDSLYGNHPHRIIELNCGSGNGGDVDSQSSLTGFLSVRLVTVFHDLQQLTRLVNHHTKNNTRLEGEQFQEAVCSIQLRLLHLKDNSNGENGNCNDNEIVAAECLRLGMLAFLSTTFKIPGRRARPAYLTEQMRSACQRIDPSTPELRVVVFWLLIVGVISVLDVGEPWLLCKWGFVAGSRLSWEGALERLRSVMWITSIHDDLGKKAYNELMAGDLSQSVDP